MRSLTFLLLSALASSASAQGLQAGAAQVDITPPAGAPMAGYYTNRAATGTHDALHAKALVFEKGGIRVALVACDLVSLPQQLSEEARDMITKDTGIPRDHVMISATHSHTSPVILTNPSRYNLQGEMKRIAAEYTVALPAKIASAVAEANAHLQPAQIRVGVAPESSIGFNRRYFMKDGTIGWNPGKLNPKILKPAGPVDPSVPVIYVETPEGRGIAAYVNVAVHADTTGGLEFSADYPATLGKVLSMAKGPDLITEFTIGAAGNVNHLDVSRKQPQQGFQEASRIGAVLAGDVLKTIQHAPVATVASIGVSDRMLNFDVPKYSADEIAWARKTQDSYGKADAAPFLDLVKAARIIELNARHGAPIAAEVQVISLGDQVAFVGFPGEMFAEFGIHLKSDSPFPVTVAVALANNALSYVPTREAFPQGAYEVVSSRLPIGAGEAMVDSALAQLRAIYPYQP